MNFDGRETHPILVGRVRYAIEKALLHTLKSQIENSKWYGLPSMQKYIGLSARAT
jgi:hypothetical protein